MPSTRNNKAVWSYISVLIASVTLAANLCAAQVQTTTTTSQGEASKTVTVENGEVVYVSGNNLVVKMADGSLRHFDNVPDSVKINADGQELGVRDLRVGMKLQRTITTTTVPETIKTVQTVTGKVWSVMPPSSVILTLENGKNQQFKIPAGQTFNIDGRTVDAWGLKKGMKVSASKVVEAPNEVVTRQAQITGTMPPPPPPPPADAPILVVEEIVPVPVETAEAALPKTGSPLPLLGMLGLLSLASSLGLKAFRMS